VAAVLEVPVEGTPIVRAEHHASATVTRWRTARCERTRHDLGGLREAAVVPDIEVATTAVGRYLLLADGLLPGRIIGFYLVGSSALGAFRDGRSDIDVIGVVDRPLTTAEIRRLRFVQIGSGVRTTARAVAGGHRALPGTVNSAYVCAEDLARPVTSIRPVASHVAGRLHRGAAFDVNPVVWKELAEHGIAVRGPEPACLGLDPEPARLRRWNLDNLNGYWSHWAALAMRGGRANSPLLPTGWIVAWGALGPPRLHYTIATGEVVSKGAAGEYALDTFDREWHPIVQDGLAFTRGERIGHAGKRKERIARAGQFAAEVIRSANALKT